MGGWGSVHNMNLSWLVGGKKGGGGQHLFFPFLHLQEFFGLFVTLPILQVSCMAYQDRIEVEEGGRAHIKREGFGFDASFPKICPKGRTFCCHP